MGLFDFFGKEKRGGAEDERSRRISFDDFKTGEYSDTPTQNGPVTVFHPKSFQDVEKVINTLKSGKNAIVYLNELSTATGYRVLDMLSGAVYALDGSVYELQNNMFFFAPAGINVK
ncbi:MAG: hypothetical protein DBX59_08900 [Bacillota bacterium]|nr:MAG: hypothetical protein DBX59_08900 [Bacillota bacterium]